MSFSLFSNYLDWQGMEFTKGITLSDKVIMRELEQEAVLLNLESQSYYALNDVGVRILKTVSDSACVEEAYNILLEEFNVEPEVLRADMHRLLGDMLELGLVSTI